MRIIFLALIAFSLTIVSCQKSQNPEEKIKALVKERNKIDKEIAQLQKSISQSDKTDKFRKVKFIILEPTEFNTFLKVNGKIDGDENVAASAKVPGVVDQIFIKTGDKVRKGQILASLDDEIMQKTLTEVRSQYDFVLTVYEKQKRLWDQKIGSEMQYLSAKNNKEAMENRIKSLQEQIAMYNIVSPINGTVEDIAIKIGQSVAPGLPLVRVINLSNLKVVADVSEVYSSKINKNDDVEIYIPDLNYKAWSKITFSSKFINPFNRTFVVEAALKQGAASFSANMIAVLHINDYKSKEAIVIPVSNVLHDQNSSYVFIAEKSGKNYIAKKRVVEQGANYNGKVEIVKGLEPGQMLITTNLNSIIDGETVNPQ